MQHYTHILQHNQVLYSYSAALLRSIVLTFCSTIVEYCTPILQHYSESGQSSCSLALAWLWLSFDFTVLTFCSAHLISSPAVGSLKGRGEWPGWREGRALPPTGHRAGCLCSWWRCPARSGSHQNSWDVLRLSTNLGTSQSGFSDQDFTKIVGMFWGFPQTWEKVRLRYYPRISPRYLGCFEAFQKPGKTSDCVIRPGFH